MFCFWILSVCSIPITDAGVQQNDFFKIKPQLLYGTIFCSIVSNTGGKLNHYIMASSLCFHTLFAKVIDTGNTGLTMSVILSLASMSPVTMQFVACADVTGDLFVACVDVTGDLFVVFVDITGDLFVNE